MNRVWRDAWARRESPWIAAFLAAALALVAYAPGLGRQEFVGTEDFRARIASEMLNGGDRVVPHYYGRPILTKPPGHYWTLAATFRLTGTAFPATARLPSLLALGACAALLAAAAARAGGLRAGLLAALAWLLTANTLKNGGNAEIDPLFHAFVLGAALAVWRGLGAALGWWLAAGALFGCAALVKGPAVLPFLMACAPAAWAAGNRPGKREWLAVLVPAAALGLAWPVLLRMLPSERLAGAIAEGLAPAGAWDREALADTALYPLALLAAGLPFNLAAFARLRARGRPTLDRFAFVFALAAFAILLLSAAKGTRYLLPCLSMLSLAGVLRLEVLARTSAYVRAVAVVFLVVAAVAVPLTRDSLGLGGAVTLAALGVAGLAASGLAPRRPVLALAILLVPARALLPQVYVPAWEAAGESVRPAVAELLRLSEGCRTLGVAGLETPRLIDPLGKDVSYYDRAKDLRLALRGGARFDGLLVRAKRLERELPGHRLHGVVPYEGMRLELWLPED